MPAVELPICPPEAPVSNAGEKDRRTGVQKKNAHLPRPEEPILQRVHTRHRKRPNASYSRRIPRRRILPRRTVPAKRRRITDPPDEQPAVVITSAELPGNSHPKGRLRLIDARAPGGACHPRPHSARARAGAGADGLGVPSAAKGEVGVGVQDDAVGSSHEACPGVDAAEAVVNGDVGTVAAASASYRAHHVVHL